MTGGPRHLKAADYRAMRWANGLGVTTELAREPRDEDRYRWRISIATVDRDGPFSDFPGYDRIITTLKGDGMTLSFGDAHPPVTISRSLEPVPFSGDWKTDCRLLCGVVTDFNVISDRASGRSEVTVLRAAGGSHPCPLSGGAQLIYAAEGEVLCHHGNGAILLSQGESLIRHRGEGDVSVEVAPEGGVLLIDLELPPA